MPSELLSSITGGGGGAGVNLTPDLTFPSSIQPTGGFTLISNIDATSGLTTVLNLSGKFIVDLMYFDAMTAENVTVKLTVDGTVIWNDTFAAISGQLLLLGSGSLSTNDAVSTSSSIKCDSSLLLEFQTATDTAVSFGYLARPIL